MTRFAIHAGVAAVFFLVEDVGVAGFTGLVTGEVDRTGGQVCQGIPAVVSVLSKTARHQEAADCQKGEDADQEDGC